MLSFAKIKLNFFAFCFAYIITILNAADVLVQLHVNRPFNDVNEKFVSFAIQPEELYRALDGDNRRVITRMAALLGDSYVKFVNDYEFAMSSELKLRNPTNIIWKGFNRWASAVNWTMVIPLPYDPDTWDPMETLRILNSSYLNGISECVWQLGTDFGSSHAEEYVAELKTLNLMVESFKPYVEDWRIMGADISAGSSAEETMRYIAMSKELNTAFGWTQSSETTSINSLSTLPHSNDAALHVLLREKVPLWLTLPHKPKTKSISQIGSVHLTSDEANEALEWAKVLGDAASTGYNAVFKRITVDELERPKFSYFVSALFKKVMGSRVFPARPINIFKKANKLYTHCANTVSGGIAFMIANTNEHALQVQVHSLSKMSATEVWQYALTMKKGAVHLNDQRIWYNTTLKPQKSVKQSNKPILLTTPGRSVSFYVLPTANLEHCQYTEIIADELEKELDEKTHEQRYSSSDKLLRKLIQETSLTKSALARAISRRRRYSTVNSRPKRFVLKEKNKKADGWGKMFKPFGGVALAEPEIERPIKKRENPIKLLKQPSPFNWFTEWMENTMSGDLPLLKRGVRSINNDDDDDADADDSYFGPLFSTRNSRTTKAITKRITEIKKPEQKIKPIFDMEKFDEEEFFKQLGSYREPEYPRLPDGDVILEHITNIDGDEIEDEREERVEKLAKKKSQFASGSSEVINEMKPLKLLPTELYEGLALNPFKPASNNFGSIGGALNSLLFPEPFSKKPTKTKKVVSIEKEFKPHTKNEPSLISQLAKDFIRTQQELSKTFAEDNYQSTESKEKLTEAMKANADVIQPTTTTKTTTTTIATAKASSLEESVDRKKKRKFVFKELIPDHNENYFGEHDNDGAVDFNIKSRSDEIITKPKFDEISWWDLSPLSQKRNKRALLLDFADNVLQGNMISKDDELVPLGTAVQPQQLATYEYRVENVIGNDKQNTLEKKSTETDIVSTFKEKVTDIVDIFSRHFGAWYNTLTRNFDSSIGTNREKVDVEAKTNGSNNVK